MKSFFAILLIASSASAWTIIPGKAFAPKVSLLIDDNIAPTFTYAGVVFALFVRDFGIKILLCANALHISAQRLKS